jgi:hypothetical protein
MEARVKRILIAAILTFVMTASTAHADYTLICTGGGSSATDVRVPGATGFDDACQALAGNPTYSSCIDSQGLRGACPLSGGSPSMIWRNTAVVYATEGAQSGTLANGNSFAETLDHGTYIYTETTRGGTGTCTIRMMFSPPPGELRSGTAPYRALTVTAGATATPLPAGSYSCYSGRGRYASTIANLPAQGVFWEDERNPGMAGETAALVGCNANDAKSGRSVWTLTMPGPGVPAQFEIQTIAGNNLLTARYVYQRQ